MNPLGTTFRAETQTNPTIPPLPEEEGGEDTTEPEDPPAELLGRVLAGSREPDVSRVKLARMPAPTGSRRLPPAKAWQDWFTIRLTTWANVISPEFDTELVKNVLGQPADLSRHGAADRQLAHEISFNIDDKMLPHLLGADLWSGCAILRVFHEEILSSTAEHTAALHERFAKPIPCRDKTKLLLTLRQWLTDLKELQAAGSSPSKETVMKSLKTVTGGTRDLNNVHEIADLLAPNDPGKLYSAIERKAAGWAVMDADTRLNDSSAGAGKGTEGDRKGAYSTTIPCKHFAKGTKCRFSHRSSDSKSGGKSSKGKKSSSERDRCKKCGKITNPPHWARSCPENSSSSAQVVLTSTQVLSVSLFSAARGKKDGYFYERCPEGYGVLKGPRGNVKLERSGGLDYLVEDEGQHVFPALLTYRSVDGSYCRVDNVDMEHLRGGHLEFDPGCMTMRERQHRRQDDRETAGARGEVFADLTGRLPMAYNGSEYLLVALRRETRFGFVRVLMNKRSETIKDAMTDMQSLLR